MTDDVSHDDEAVEVLADPEDGVVDEHRLDDGGAAGEGQEFETASKERGHIVLGFVQV